MRAKKTIVGVVAVAILGACASDAGEGTDTVASPLRAPVVCLVPVDTDGDGRGDVMRSSSFVVTDPTTCRDRYNGAVTLDPARLSPRIDAKSIRPQTTGGHGGGQSYRAGDGIPPAVAAEVARFNLHGRERYRPGYNCQNFSNDLERHLQLEGFDATCTAINGGGGDQRYGHMIVDVHIDGTAWWIEPQNGLPYELDDDGDGDVDTVRRGGLGPPSEGGLSVEVFENHGEYCQTYPHHCGR